MAQYRFPQDFEKKSYRARHLRKNSNIEHRILCLPTKGRTSYNWFKFSNFAKLMRKVSSFFPAVSKELHVSLSNVENVKEIKKMKVLAAAKEVSENVKKAKILENYNSSNQLRKQRRLEGSQNAREFDPETAAIDDITLDMIDEEPQRVQKKRNQYARPRN